MDKMNAQKERFEESNPDVEIVPDVWTFDLRSFYAKAEGGVIPTLFPTHFTEADGMISAGYVADISNVLKKRGYEGKFNPQILDLVSKDGKIYGFPKDAYVLGLTYNHDMFKAAGLVNEDGTPMQPKDWYELVEFAVKIKEVTGKAGIVFPTANNSGGWIFTPVAWSFGVDFMEQDENGMWHATFNTPEAVKALEFIKDLKWKYDVLPTNALIDDGEMYKVFATGKAGMIITAGDMPWRMAQYDMKPEQLGIMGLPAGPARHVTLMGGTFVAIKEGSTDDQIDAAIRWIETTANFNATEEFKTNLNNSIKAKVEKEHLVGIKSMSVWSSGSESLRYEHQLIDENVNCNPNQVRLYNEFVANCPAELQPEEPVCAQNLYSILDGCLQEVLTNKDADCKALIEKANNDFQVNYLDNL